MLTVEQLHEIREIIATHHQAFAVNTIGPDAVPYEVLAKLKELGLVDMSVSSIEDAYLYGQLVANAADKKLPKMGYDAFKEHIRKHPIPLSEYEKRAVDFAQQKAAQYIVGLGNRVNIQTGETIIEADAKLRAETREGVRNLTARNIAERESAKQLKSDLGWMAKDWTRDWDRIAVTEKHTAMERGVADNLSENFGPDVYVAKIRSPDSCNKCKELHEGPDDAPYIFKLSTLEANGLNNFGRKAADWRAVTGATHPYCQCNLVRVPAGWGFNEEGQMVPGGELGKRFDDGPSLKKAMHRAELLQKAFTLQGRVNFQGLDIAIENKKGTTRKWTDADGNKGSSVMHYAYGYIVGTNGDDEDEIDVYLGPDPDAPTVFIIHQKNPKTGIYDEAKIFLGFASSEQAKAAYLEQYDNPEFFATIAPMAMDHFKRWAGLTGANEGELFKAGTPYEKLVIPLSKAQSTRELGSTGSLATEVAAAEGRAGSRNPGPGTFANYAAGITKPPPPTMVPEHRQMYEEFLDGSADRIKSNTQPQAVYEVAHAVPRNTRAYEFVIPADWRPEKADVAANREGVENISVQGTDSEGLENTVVMGSDERVQ